MDFDTENNNIELGGFPPLIYINNETKKKREFQKKINSDIGSENLLKLNILGIKNILGNNDSK